MSIINTIIGTPLGWLFYFCYRLVSDYAFAIILFTLLTKVLLFPVSLASQKNSIKMVRIQSQLEDIKQRYSDNTKLYIEEQKKLYKKEKYSTWLALLPLLLQIPIVLGVINVMYNPLQHLMQMDSTTIAALAAKTEEVLGHTLQGMGGQISIIDTVQSNPELFRSVVSADMLSKIQNFQAVFLGLNLTDLPALTSVTVLIPLLSGLSAFILSYAQNKMNVLSKEQSFLAQWGMAIFMVLFSGYFAFVVPMGIGFYWIIGNLSSILVTIVCNMIYNPAKYIDYENRSKKEVLSRAQKAEKRQIAKRNHARAVEDSKRFFSKEKQLMFYSESSGFYKYFSRMIDYVTSHSDLVVHYVTSDPDDKIFETKNPQIETYYIGPKELIVFMMKLDADMVVMTLPDLEQYHIKRSLIRKDIEYIYTDHGMGSYHMMLRKGALDYFDTIFCYGPNHVEETRQTEAFYGLKEKKIVETGFGLFDEMLESYAKMETKENPIPKILIAPSWQKDNIMELCLDEMLEGLLGKNVQIIVRPHPEFVKRFSGKMKSIISKYEDRFNENFIINIDFSSNFDVYSSDLVITDWSSIAPEFSFITKRPSLFINTPVKIMNPEYTKIKAIPLEISLRDKLGVSLDVEEMDKLPQIVDELFENKDAYRESITKLMGETMFNVGETGKVSGEYIIQTLTGNEGQ